MEDAVTITASLFGTTEAKAEVLCDLLDNLCGAAYEAAEILYSPYEGVSPDAGKFTVGEAVDRVLSDIAEAAPEFPAWALESGTTSNPLALMFLNMAVSEVIASALECVETLGWVEIDDSTDDSFAPAVEAGQRVLGIVREARGIMGGGDTAPC